MRHLLSVLLLAGAVSLGAVEKPPHVVVILSDEIDSHDLGVYGGAYPTPQLNRLAASGMRFTEGYTSGAACTPSRWSLLTGQYPSRCRSPEFRASFPVDQPCNITWNTRVVEGQPTIPRLLGSAGYVTAGFGKTHIVNEKAWHDASAAALGSCPAGSLTDAAVNSWLVGHQQMLVGYLSRIIGYRTMDAALMSNYDDAPHPALKHHNHAWIASAAVRFLSQHGRGPSPVFAYIAPTALHGPWHADEFAHDPTFTPGGQDPRVAASALDRQAMQAKLAGLPPHVAHKTAGIAALDHLVGQVLDTLEAQGMADNTIVVYSADHGVEPGKASAYVRGNQVPLLIRWPGVTPPGSVTDRLFAHVDLLPTIAAAAGVRVPAGEVFDGVDQRPLLTDGKTPVRHEIYTEMGYARGIYDGRYQAIALRYPVALQQKLADPATLEAPNHLGVRGTHAEITAHLFPGYYDADQFYDLGSDPWQLRNRQDDEALAQARAGLVDRLFAMTGSMPNAFPRPVPAIQQGERWQALTATARALPFPTHAWIARDHGAIVWPPTDRGVSR